MTTDPASALAELRRRLGEWSDLEYALSVLNWDQSTYMPPGGAESRARQMALLDVYGRVIHTLESEQGPASVHAPVELTQITHQQIASRVGASREMVSRLLKDLEKGGYVELGIKRITLKKKLPARW